MASTSSSWLGFPLMDVFNIVYLGLDEVEPKEQLGTITLHCSGGVQDLYRLEEVDINRSSIKYGDSIPLTVKGPSVPFFDYVFIEFDLFCGAYKGEKQLQWDPIPHEVSVKSVSFTSNDGTGQILVYIGAYANATVAHIELRLLENSELLDDSKLLDDSVATNVHGVVFASNSELELIHCANVLFAEKPDNGLVVGHDGLIPLSRSFVGVPLHSKLYVEVSLIVDGQDHTDFVTFDPVKEGVREEFIYGLKEKKILIKVTWVDISEYDDRKNLIPLMYGHDSVTERNITLLNVDESLLEVEEEVAPEFVKRLDFVSLFNFIQCCRLQSSNWMYSGHIYKMSFDYYETKRLEVKSLMNYACRTLGIKVKTKISEDIRKEFNIGDSYIRSWKRLKRSYSREDILHSEEDIPHIDSILRQREKETFINKPLLVDVPISPLLTERRRFSKPNQYFASCFSIFMESADSQHRDPVKFREATKWLNALVNGDAGLADCLSYDAVECLLEILAEIDNSKDREDLNVTIQSLAVRILSRALVHNMFHKYSKDAVPALVKLMSNPLTELNIAGVMALTRLAYGCPRCMQVILENGALEQAQEIAKRICYLRLHELRQWVAKFLAVICYRDLPDDKVKVALIISDDLLKRDSISHRHLVSTCYALQYLTYKRTLTIQGEAWDKLIRRLIGLITNCFRIDCPAVACSPPVIFGSTVIASSALGVVGNIARWGHSNQIQTLANDSRLLQCLGMLLCFKFKKFTKEACQIISNIAARSQSWIKNMHEANLIEPLCNLLEEDMYESDVKMEAAWAICNGIYGDEYRQIN